MVLPGKVRSVPEAEVNPGILNGVFGGKELL